MRNNLLDNIIMKTATLSKQQKASTFASTLKGWNKELTTHIKDLQLFEETKMSKRYLRKEADIAATDSLQTIALLAQAILDEAHTAMDCFK